MLTLLLIPHPETLHSVPSSVVLFSSVIALMKLLLLGNGSLTCSKHTNKITHIAFTSK
jgi:hypothetical protein